ncbi:aminoglycoside phosphotransferase family protein [Pseudogemmobacter blasticus]|uniref:Aminoglycoside phosphotransferase n=1 Tax=Fuscovulum blasticum DSM 2131 TaxID=1188250 RepID=A0A2T4JFH9_FUSBL|nr:phosphotransferase [Fuscovulum blasticum]PTE16593.1 aminoglycoside phosphotransferase [Fuscovulum blasticum DSM 2131]
MTRNREAAKTLFLRQAGWDAAVRRHLAGDASARRYERLERGADRAVLMDSPPGAGDDVQDFLRIDAHLTAIGLSAPKILAAEPAQGFLLLEDLGDNLYTAAVTKDPAQEAPLYAEAVEVLLHLQRAAPPAPVPDLSAEDWARSAGFVLDFYARAATGAVPDGDDFHAALTTLLQTHADGPRILILRDYHAGNLLWLPDRRGLARVGLLDFQQAQMGQPAYDLVSLLQDARRDVAPEVETEGVARMARGLGLTVADLSPAYATLGALRALRILGIFARLCLVDGKPGYLDFVPRVWGQLQRNLSHPALHGLRDLCGGLLPPPTPETLTRIRAQCAPSR